MAEPFCADTRKNLAETAKELGLRFHEKATVVTIEGPRFSTRAESNMFRKLGADIINMSTVPEAVLAKELGLCYQNIAMVTDFDCWKSEEETVSVEAIIKVMKGNAENAKKLFLSAIPKIPDEKNCSCAEDAKNAQL